jgi:uncharacterized protein (TIGR00369 family)
LVGKGQGKLMAMREFSAQELNAEFTDSVPDIANLNVTVEAQQPGGRLRMRARVGQNNLRPGGTVSGPTIMALADWAIFISILTQIGPVEMAVTTNLNINFLKRPQPNDLIAEVSLLKLGRRLAIGEVSIFSDGEDQPVAHVTGTYSLPPVSSASAVVAGN